LSNCGYSPMWVSCEYRGTASSTSLVIVVVLGE
jgi:hypothetical protein